MLDRPSPTGAAARSHVLIFVVIVVRKTSLRRKLGRGLQRELLEDRIPLFGSEQCETLQFAFLNRQ